MDKNFNTAKLSLPFSSRRFVLPDRENFGGAFCAGCSAAARTTILLIAFSTNYPFLKFQRWLHTLSTASLE
jgi:hypothetical protein